MHNKSISNSKNNKNVVKVGLSFLLLLNSTIGHGDEFEKFFQLKSDLFYQSNPGFSKSDKRSAFTLRINPELQLSLADELSKYYLNAGVVVDRNSNEQFLVNYVGPKLLGGWNRELSFGKIGLEGKYNEVAARIEQLERTGAIANVDNITKSGSLKGLLDIDFNSKFSLNNNIEYGNTRYTEPGIFNNFELFSVDTRLIYKKSDRLIAYSKASYVELAPSGNLIPNSDVTSLVVGGTYTPSDSLTVDANIGAYNASGRFSDSGIQTSINASYVYNRFNGNFQVSRKMNPGGDGVFQLNDFWLIGGAYELAENQAIGVEYFSNKAQPDREVSSFDVTYDSFGVFYSKRYENWTGKIYANAIGLDLDGDQRRQHMLGFSLNYEPIKF